MMADIMQVMAPGKNVPGDFLNVPVVKTSKRQYLLTDPLPKIENELKINEYRNFVVKILCERANLKEKEALYYTEDMTLFKRATTVIYQEIPSVASKSW
jgi:hypothetical protein